MWIGRLRGGGSRYQKEWGNLAMRANEEPTDCPNVSKITPDMFQILKNSFNTVELVRK